MGGETIVVTSKMRLMTQGQERIGSSYREFDAQLREEFPDLADALMRWLSEPIVKIRGFDPEVAVTFPQPRFEDPEGRTIELIMSFGPYLSGQRFVASVCAEQGVKSLVSLLDEMAWRAAWEARAAYPGEPR